MQKQILIRVCHFFLCLGIFLSPTQASDPGFEGVEGDSTAQINTQGSAEISSGNDFQYTPIPDPHQPRGIKLARKAFDKFIGDDKNAGLLVDFLKQFDAASLKLLKRKVLGSTQHSTADSRFWQRMKQIGADTEALEEARRILWKPHEKRYNKTFKQLRQLEETFEELQKSADTTELKEQADALRRTIATLRAKYCKDFRLTIAAIEKELNKNFFASMSDDYGHLTAWIEDKLELLSEMVPQAKTIKSVDSNGNEVQRNLFQELDARLRFVTNFARAAGKTSPPKYGLTYVLSWVFTDKNVDIAIAEVEKAQAEKMKEVGVQPKKLRFYKKYFEDE